MIDRVGLASHISPGGSRERRAGQSLVLFAICLTALVAVAGLVVDIGGAWSQSRGQQKVADVAALAVHLMTNTALTGATYDIDGGQQLVPQEV